MEDETERRHPPANWDTPPLDGTRQTSSWAWLSNGVGTPADRRNQVRLTVWSLIWILGFAAASQTLRGNLGDLGLEAGSGAAWVAGPATGGVTPSPSR